MFKSCYGFKVYNRKINVNGGPTEDLSKHLTEFVAEEDVEDGLLIIYYAGHGIARKDTRPGDIILAG